jgi:N-acetylglutamate synthase-like GNAT family acetyltransferase
MVKIRKANLRDAKAISLMMTENINLLSSKKDSQKHLSAMKKYVSEENIKKYIKDFEVFIALDNNEIVGTISFEKDLIFPVYVKGSTNFVKGRIWNEMLKFVETYAKKLGENKISLISMPTTKTFFEERGYKVAEALSLNFDGIDFPEFRLSKEI